MARIFYKNSFTLVLVPIFILFTLFTLFVLLLLSTATVSQAAQSKQSSQIITKSSVQELTVVLDWFINPDHAPLFVAQQQGFFRQQQLSVTFITPTDPADGIKLVAADHADLALTYQPSFMLSLDQNLPLVWAGTLINQPLASIAVLADGPVQSINDLKGKTIAYSSAGVDGIMLKTMLAYHGLSIDDVQTINVHYGLTQALLSHRVDGFTGAMRNVEPIEMAQQHTPVRLFYPEQHGFPDYDELIFVTNIANKNNPAIARFLIALQQGIAYLQAHPHETWQAFAKLHPELNNGFNQQAWLTTVNYFAKHPAEFEPIKYQKLAQFLYQQKLIHHLITQFN